MFARYSAFDASARAVARVRSHDPRALGPHCSSQSIVVIHYRQARRPSMSPRKPNDSSHPRSRREPSAPRASSRKRMHAWVIRRSATASPRTSFQKEVIDTPEPGPNEVLVISMAAGVNYNGIWAGLGKPVSVLDVHKQHFHIAGTDARASSGSSASAVTPLEGGRRGRPPLQRDLRRVPRVQRLRPHGLRRASASGATRRRTGASPSSRSRKSQQLMPKAAELDAGKVARATALDLLHRVPHARRPRERAARRDGPHLGRRPAASATFACQITRTARRQSRSPSSRAPRRREMAKKFGRDGHHQPQGLPRPRLDAERDGRARRRRASTPTKAFGKAFMKAAGRRKAPDVVFEHAGQETFPTSVFLAAQDGPHRHLRRDGGFDLHFDVRHLWMRQKTIIGSHFAQRRAVLARERPRPQGDNQAVHDGALRRTRTSRRRTRT